MRLPNEPGKSRQINHLNFSYKHDPAIRILNGSSRRPILAA